MTLTSSRNLSPAVAVTVSCPSLVRQVEGRGDAWSKQSGSTWDRANLVAAGFKARVLQQMGAVGTLVT